MQDRSREKRLILILFIVFFQSEQGHWLEDFYVKSSTICNLRVNSNKRRLTEKKTFKVFSARRRLSIHLKI